RIALDDDDDDDVLGVLSLDSSVYQKMWLPCCDSSKVLAMKVKRLVRVICLVVGKVYANGNGCLANPVKYMFMGRLDHKRLWK
ncbi:hypothetical protein Tco_0415734, partial [Tanacetum coccineum]